LLKDEEEKDNLFANFPIGATMQDGGKRKEAISELLPLKLGINGHFCFLSLPINL